MAKMKRRYYHHGKRKNRLCSCKDTHHLFYVRREWEQGVYAELRKHHYSRALVPKNSLHHDLHVAIKRIPLPEPEVVEEVLRKLDALDEVGALHEEDYIERKLDLFIELFDLKAKATADALRKQLEIVQEYYSKPP